MIDAPSSNDSFPRAPHSQPTHLRSRSKGLRKLGVSEDDVHLAEKLLDQIPACSSDPNKAERILGYASSRLAREKALRLLGATEEEVEKENAKNLGSLGQSGRRRSFSMVDPNHPDILAFTKRHSTIADGISRRHTFSAVTRRHRRRRTSAKEQRRRSSDPATSIRLRNQASEIKSLKAKISELEKRLTIAAIQSSNGTAATANP